MTIQNTVINNETSFTLDLRIYPKDVIFKACYAFIDRAYIFLENVKKNEIKVSFKTREGSGRRQVESLKGDFLNELLNVLVRKEINIKNQKILEYIVGGAITAALEKPNSTCADANPMTRKIEEEVEALKKEIEAELADDCDEDPLGIKKVYEDNG